LRGFSNARMTVLGLALRPAVGVEVNMVSFLRGALLLAAFVLAPVAQAQYLIHLKLEKPTYLAQEPVLATVTVTNRSGADAILGEKNKQSWLSFDVTSPGGTALPPLAATSDEPMLFPAGQTIARQFYITDTHAFSDEGNYSVKATAYHGGSGQYYESNRSLLTVVDVKPMMAPITFGVPQGYDEAGRTRDYVLLSTRDSERTYLYVRLVDVLSKTKMVTKKLGTYSNQADPQVTLDKLNCLHVMFLSAPEIYAYFIIQPDGMVKHKELVKQSETSRPKLYLTGDNSVVMRGGFAYDPAAVKAKAAANKPRSIGQKPPGL
jgi:hypothetical protein